MTGVVDGLDTIAVSSKAFDIIFSGAAEIGCML